VTKAKTRFLTLIVCALLGVVFAFTVGHSLAVLGSTINVTSNPKQIHQIANQNHSMINDTIEAPIPFGEGTRLTEIALRYSYGYDIDVRFEYSLSWTDGLDTSNVILNFADRDSFIVDDQFIYFKDGISAGNGILRIINGVSFVDPEDETYFGKSLTITITPKVVKKSDTSHAKLEEENSLACDMWTNLRTDAITSNFILYNYLDSSTSHGVTHPENETAYSKNTKLFGNKYYAGCGMYVATSSALKLRVSVVATWYYKGSEESPTLPPDNNILLNYSDNWTKSGANGSVDVVDFDYTLPANFSGYINILDSVEITSVLYSSGGAIDYSDHVLQVKEIFINGTSFTGELTDGEITDTAPFETALEDYEKSDYTVHNNTVYNNALFFMPNSLAEEEETQYYACDVTITNNTNETKEYSVSWAVNCYISNGSTAEPVENSTLTSATWHREVIKNIQNFISVSEISESFVVNAKSSARLLNYYQILSGIRDYFVNNANLGIVEFTHDIWIEVVPTISEVEITNESNYKLSFETTLDRQEGVVEIFLKNNTDKTLKVENIETTGSLQNPQNKTCYVKIDTYTYADSIENWGNTYWQYYKKDGDKFVQCTSVDDNVSRYKKGSDFRSLSWGTDLNNIVGTSVMSGEKVKFKTVQLSSFETDDTTVYSATLVNAYTVASVQDGDVKILKDATNNALINNSENAVLVRMTATGTIEESYFETYGTHVYYIGALMPGQIINFAEDVVVSSFEITELEKIEGLFVFDSSLITWDDDFKTRMEDYFS